MRKTLIVGRLSYDVSLENPNVPYIFHSISTDESLNTIVVISPLEPEPPIDYV